MRKSALIAHDDPDVFMTIVKKLPFLSDVKYVSNGHDLSRQLQTGGHLVLFIGHRLEGINPSTLLYRMRIGEIPCPRLLYMIRSGQDFPFGPAVVHFEGAEIISLLVDLPRVAAELSSACGQIDRQLWRRLRPIQRELLQVHEQIFANLFAAQTPDDLDGPLVDKGADILVEAAQNDDFDTVLKMLRNHDDYTFTHNLNVACLMTVFGLSVGVGRDDMRIMAKAGILHDIGKGQIPLEVLHKPGPLNETEWTTMKSHVDLSVKTLRASGMSCDRVINVAGQHHEKLDGSGYPNGLCGHEIDDLALVCAIADVFSALTDKRPYKPAKSTEEALAIMASMSGRHLEPNIYIEFKHMVARRSL